MAYPVTANVERFDEAADWFLSRIVLTEEQARVIGGRYRQDAFWVGASLQADQIQNVFDEIGKAIENGEPFEEWRERVRAELTNDAHAETVFRNATQRAYNAGRWEQMADRDVAQFRPYLIFDAVLDSGTTVICRECNGTILHRDDPWWNGKVPPLHHKCRSSLRSLRESEAQRLGITGEPTERTPDGDWGEIPTTNGWRPPPGRYAPEIEHELNRKSETRAPHITAEHHSQEFWEKRYERYGQASKSLAWGRAAQERGLDRRVADVRRDLSHLAASAPGVKRLQETLERLDPDLTVREAGGDIVPMAKAAAALSEHLRGVNPKAVTHYVGNDPRWSPALGFYSSVADKSLRHPNAKWVVAHDPSRGYMSPGVQEISFSSASSLVHEWAHAVEYLNEELRLRSVSFYRARTKGDAFEQLEDLFPGAGYEPGERTKRDGWYDFYVGAWYSVDGKTPHFTELMSMSADVLFAGERQGRMLEQLAKKDPELLLFLLGQLSGR